MDRFANMTAFVRAVEKGGFAAAADGLGISATMVGLHVRRLEDLLGSKLLNRTTRSQSLTDVGRLYYERCKQILADLDDADLSASELRRAPRGKLRVTAPVSFGAHALTPVIAEYLALYPEVDVDLRLNDRIVDLVEDGSEVAARVGVLPDSSLIAKPIAPYRLIFCASPAYLARHGEPQRPKDLTSHNCLSFDIWGTRTLVRFESGDEVELKGQLRANSGEALRVAAREGLGIVLLPVALLAEDVAAGRLVPILRAYALPARPMHLVYLPDRRPTPKLRTFIDFVAERLERHPEAWVWALAEGGVVGHEPERNNGPRSDRRARAKA